jgi:hypothetical protein
VCGVVPPPPAVAEAALEQLAKSIHKRPQHTHLILVPRLMTAYWRKLLGKICTLTFTVPAGTDVWRISQFEPLIVGLYLPLIRHYPWTLKGAPMLDRVEWSLRSLPLTDHKWGGGIFCGNFSWNRGPWKPCLQVWCGSCYVPLDHGEFPIAKPKDGGGFEVQDASEEWRYKKGHAGDNLITHFSVTYAISGIFCKEIQCKTLRKICKS